MISFRYHIVSLVAVFLALAVGIVIGTTALNGPVTSDLRHQVNDLKADRTRLADQAKNLQGQVDTAGTFASTFGAHIVAGVLKDQSVLLIELPGTPTSMSDGVAAQLTNAGAKLTGRLQLAASYVDPTQGASIQSLATTDSVHPQGCTLPATSDAGQLGGALLACVLTGKAEATDLTTVLSAFSGLHMISSDASNVTSAKDIVVVGDGSQPRENYAGQAELALVTQLNTFGGHVVVAGGTGSDRGNGIVNLVRNDASKSSVSTVDNADTAFGQVSTALAMEGAANSQVGQYGTGAGAQTLFPNPSK